MRKFAWYLLGLPAAAVVVVLAVINRHEAVVNLDPFGGAASALSFRIPLFILLFATFALGLLAGAGLTWLGQGRWRRRARRSRREAARMAYEARRAREQEAAAVAIGPPRGA